MSICEPLSKALFIFWVCGIYSVLLDMDHIWILLGRREPVNFTHWPGRCLHHPIVFLLLSIVSGCLIFPSIFGFYVQIPGQIGELATLLGESGIIVITIIGLYLFDKKTKGFLDEKIVRKDEEKS